MTNIYCGNNALQKTLLNGSKILGNRYSCLKKGIGKGLSLPYDENYLGDYLPIDNRQIYCGLQNNLPNGYDYFGNLSQCLQKGIGIGKRQVVLKGDNKPINKLFIIYTILIILIPVFVFFILFYTKPSIILKKDKSKTINWFKFITIFTLIVSVYELLLIIILHIRFHN